MGGRHRQRSSELPLSRIWTDGQTEPPRYRATETPPCRLAGRPRSARRSTCFLRGAASGQRRSLLSVVDVSAPGLYRCFVECAVMTVIDCRVQCLEGDERKLTASIRKR